MKIILIASIVALAGCPPTPGPSVTGKLEFTGSTAGYSVVGVKLERLPAQVPEVSETEDIALPTTFPTTFDAGGGLEPVTGDYHLTAWLAAGTGTQAPAAGAPHAAMDLHFDCNDQGCTTPSNLVLTLAP